MRHGNVAFTDEFLIFFTVTFISFQELAAVDSDTDLLQTPLVILYQTVQTVTIYKTDNYISLLMRSLDSSVGIATSYGLDDRGVGVRVPVGSRIFSSPRRPNQLWDSPNLLSNGYRGLFSGAKAAGA
jgi:hypothetical protein